MSTEGFFIEYAYCLMTTGCAASRSSLLSTWSSDEVLRQLLADNFPDDLDGAAVEGWPGSEFVVKTKKGTEYKFEVDILSIYKRALDACKLSNISRRGGRPITNDEIVAFADSAVALYHLRRAKDKETEVVVEQSPTELHTDEAGGRVAETPSSEDVTRKI